MSTHLPAPKHKTEIFGDAHIHHEVRVYQMKEKVIAMAKQAFEVTDDDKKTHFKVHAKAMSMHHEKILEDEHGHKIGTIEHSLATMHKTLRIENKHGHVVAIAKTHHVLQAHSNVDVFFGDKEKDHADVHIEGSIFAREFHFKNKDGDTIAEVTRKTGALKNILTDADNYAVLVAPNVDAAMIVILVVGLDEMFEN